MEEIRFWIQNNVYFILISLIPVVYLYFTRNHDYWKKRGIKGPKPIPYFGNMLAIFNTQPGMLEFQRVKQFGRVYGYYERSKPILVVAEPEIIKFITVKEFQSFLNRRKAPVNHRISSQFLVILRDNEWKRMRSIMSPTFTTGKIKRMFDLMLTCVDGMIENLEEAAVNGKDLDVKRLYGAYTMDVISTCAFATKTNAHKEENNIFVRNAFAFFRIKLWRFLTVLMIPASVLKFMKFSITPAPAFAFFENVVKHLISQRKNSQNKPNDFLQLMLDAEDKKNSLIKDMKDINDAVINDESNDDLLKNVNSMLDYETKEKKLSETQIVANSTLFFIAGYETTASTLTLATYGLATHPRVQMKLYDEIKAFDDEHHEINFESINKLDYLHAVICEVLRHYGPISLIEREATKDCELPGIGLKIERGTIIRMPIYSIHHDPEFYENPDEFYPERFLPENLSKIRPYTFLPFGAGPRNCIGMRFALVEAKLALYKVLLKYRFLESEVNETKLHFVKNSISSIRITTKPVWTKVEKRM